MPAIRIIPAVESDVPLILELIGKLAEYEHLSHQMSATESLLREHLFGPNPVAEALIGQLDGKSVGFALYFSTFSTFLARPGIWLEDLFVLPEHRRCGLGGALFRAVAKITVERNCGRLEWSVLDWNAPAINFYRKLGATPMSDWTIQRLTGDTLKNIV
jgi:GNAT superfamily N-acetyltransferase